MKRVKKIFISGNFNIIHPGHLRILKFAKDHGEKLIVGVESDKLAGNSVKINEKLRLESISSLEYVDEAFIIRDSIEKALKKHKPNVVVKGKEHEFKYNVEENIVKKFGGKILFSSGESNLTSFDFINDEIKHKSADITFPSDYIKIHSIKYNKLKKIISNFNKLKILVIGDLIVDEYIESLQIGMSHEDPAIVISPHSKNNFLGGAGIVAAHGSKLGAQVKFISMIGKDNAGVFAKNTLLKNGVEAHLFEEDERPTSLKQRYKNQNKTLIRINHLQELSINIKLQDKIISKFVKLMKNQDAIIFSDFNYGFLPSRMVEICIKKAKEKNIFIAADSQSSSQIGDIGRFKKVDLITPTEREARLSLKNNEDGLIILSDKIQKTTKSKHVILKLNQQGIIINNYKNKSLPTSKLSALNSNPIDVAGAGDSLLTAASLAMCSGGSIYEASYLGSLAAALQIGQTGNIPLKQKSLLNEIEKCKHLF